jgi:uncharacterized protein
VTDQRVRIDPTLFASDDPVRLAAGRCNTCRTVVFPWQDACPKCSDRPLAAHTLAGSGVVWTWTRQEFMPKPPFRPSPHGWTPKAVGYVDLGDVLVEGWLVPSAHEWRIGDRVHVVVVPAWTDERGVVHTFAFELDGEVTA